MIVNNQAGAVQQPRPNKAATNARRANANAKAQNPSAAKRAPQNAAANARQTAQNVRKPVTAPQNQAAQRGPVQSRPDERTLSRTAMTRRNAIDANRNPQPQKAQENSKAFESYQKKLNEIIKKHDKNGDMKLSLAETGAAKEDFSKIDLNKDGFVDKAEMESRVSSRINAMEEILLADPGKLVKMMKELGPEISDKVGGKDSYKKIVKNLKILEANDRANGGKELKTKGNVNFMA